MPHGFTWVPAKDARHGSVDPVPHGRSYPTGTEIRTLCGQLLTADNDKLASFWPTCSQCDVIAHERAGLPLPPALQAARS